MILLDMKEIYYDNKKLTSLINRKRAIVFMVKYKQNSLLCKTKKFSGVRTIGRVKCKESQSFFLDLKISQGQAKVILIKDKKVYPLIEGSYQGRLSTVLAEGKYRIRIAGISANLNFVIKKH